MDNKRVDLRIIWNSSNTYFIIDSDISQFEWEKNSSAFLIPSYRSYAN